VSGKKQKDVCEVLRKYDVCVKYNDFSDTTMPGHNATTLEAEMSCLYSGPKQKHK
jgi:hypothetical protein